MIVRKYLKTHFVFVNHLVVSDSLWFMNCSLAGSSIHRITQASMLEWLDISFYRSSWPRDWTQVSLIAGWFFTIWATREARNSAYVQKSAHILISKWVSDHKLITPVLLTDKGNVPRSQKPPLLNHLETTVLSPSSSTSHYVSCNSSVRLYWIAIR